ncbi:MAG TPA: hypothetical protein VFX88_20290 [Actinomycetota bacterium]|nr:hypothetical protein [Actinomycetota bacterium]
MAELDPEQEAALRRLRAAFGFIEILRTVDHEQDQDQNDGDGDGVAVRDQPAPPADR